MNEQIRDALRHLEKDMADILAVMADKSTTEVILNPYKKLDGSYEGHILVDTPGIGLHNLLQHKTVDIEDPTLNLGDQIILKLDAGQQILFWSKIDKNSTSGVLLQCFSNCIKNWFDDASNIIRQTEEFSLLEYADRLLHGYVGVDELQLTSDSELQVVIERVNFTLPVSAAFKLRYLKIQDSYELDRLKSYPDKLVRTDLVKISATRAETIMSVLASITGKFIHNKSPRLECQIPKYGHRFTGVLPPASVFPAFCIRKHSPKLYTLSDFVAQGILAATSFETIISWIKRRFNILIAGGTASGKTTLANAILYEIAKLYPETRILVIEDVPELQFNTSRSLAFSVGEFFSMYDALRTTLRFKPDRIVMGEVRGAEAYTLLKAWNTGHPGGIATIHANGVDEALYRFESCVRDHPEVRINRQEIGFTINGIISIQNITQREDVNGEYVNVVRRRVTALRQIIQYDPDKDVYQDIVYDRLEESFS